MLSIEWLDNYTPTGKRMLTVERESLEFKDGRVADVFSARSEGDEWCVIELYRGWEGEKVDTIRWVGPSARKECELYVAEMVKD